MGTKVETVFFILHTGAKGDKKCTREAQEVHERDT